MNKINMKFKKRLYICKIEKNNTLWIFIYFGIIKSTETNKLFYHAKIKVRLMLKQN